MGEDLVDVDEDELGELSLEYILVVKTAGWTNQDRFRIKAYIHGWFQKRCNPGVMVKT